jgi:hypothetical protein
MALSVPAIAWIEGPGLVALLLAIALIVLGTLFWRYGHHEVGF